MTTIRTPSRTLEISMTEVTADGYDDGIDYSSEYIGNLADPNLHECDDDDCDLIGIGHYHADDETADWWVDHCRETESVNDRVAELSPKQHAIWIDAAESEGIYSRDAEDQPAAANELLDRLFAKSPAAQTLGALGGLATAAKMTPEQRQERARHAADARWAKP
jgi:hypothetical protein